MMIRHLTCCALILAVCAALLPLSSSAQGDLPGFESIANRELSGVPYVRYTRPGEVTVQILVMGAVGKTGLYEVGESTQMDELLAITGGLNVPPRTDRQSRKVTVLLYRQEAGQRRVVYEMPLEEMLTNPESYPDLRDDDIFVVDVVVNQRFDWRDALRIVSGVASIITLGSRIGRLF